MNEHLIERISWRCTKNFFFKNGGVYFRDLSAILRSAIQPHLEQNETPVVAMFDANSWTVITDIAIITSINFLITKIPHSEVAHMVSIDQSNIFENKINLLENTTNVLVGEKQKAVWSPSGKPCTSLMNLLLMLPLTSAVKISTV